MFLPLFAKNMSKVLWYYGIVIGIMEILFCDCCQ